MKRKYKCKVCGGTVITTDMRRNPGFHTAPHRPMWGCTQVGKWTTLQK